MDVLAGRTEIGFEDVTKKVTVASNCWARLLYYLYCVNSCLKDDGEDLIPRNLTDYARYYALSDDDKITILTICAGLLNVKNLIGKIFFPVDKVDGGYNGKFYKITETTELVALGIRADRVVGIGGSSKEVTTIMLITEGWVDTNFIKPVKEATQSLQRQTYVAPRVTYSSYQSPSPSYKPSPSPSPSYYTPSSSKKGCLAGKFKHILLFIVGLVILGYVSYEIAPVYFDQKDALDASNYNSWPLNTYSALITLSGEEVAYIKVYFDSNGVNQAANALSVSTTSPNQVDVSYARGRYSWWDRQYDPPQFLGATDLLSEDSFVYFRFQLSGTSLTTSFNATFIGAHSYSGSTDWTTIQWMQQTWFYGLFSLGALLVVIPGGLIVFSCLRRR